MNEEKIVNMYVNGGYTLRHLAELFNTNHHKIKRILLKYNVKITRRNTLKEFTNEHKQKISESRKKLLDNGWVPYNKGLKTKDRKCKNGTSGLDLLYGNMHAHLRHTVDINWLKSFGDIEKLKFLNRAISRNRDFGNYSKKFYISYIEKFYYDEQFNCVYENWIDNNKENYLKPSPDHIIPKSRNGKLDDLDNIQFLTWFENRCKNNNTWEEWLEIKSNLSKYFIGD